MAAKSFFNRLRAKVASLGRWGVTLAEALVLAVVAGNLMIPIAGTLQNGIERTNMYVHQDRMRIIGQNEMTRILAEASFLRAPVGAYVATITWPINDVTPIATYIMEVETIENINLATLSSEITGDFPPPENLVGTQPANLKAIVITVTNQSDGFELEPPLQIRLFSMVALPKSPNPDRIFLADNANICIYSIDPRTRNVVETFNLPCHKPSKKDDGANDVDRPGNIGVHPNGKWLVIQRKNDLSLLDVCGDSPTHGKLWVVFNDGSSQFLENPKDSEKTRKDRGVAFRPDGRYCYVTSHKPAKLHIFKVPTTLPASFPADDSFSFVLNTNTITDIHAGEDGYLYIAQSADNEHFKRLNMYESPSAATLEDYVISGMKKPFAVCTSRDGHDVYALWKDASNPYISVASSATFTTNKQVQLPSNEKDALQDIQVSGDNLILFSPSNKAKPDGRIYGVSLPDLTIYTAQAARGETTNQAVLSPTMHEVWVDRKNKGEIYALDSGEILAGAYSGSIPADRTINFLGSDAACVAAKTPEIVAIACSGGGVNTIEFVDLYSNHLYEDFSQKVASPVTHLALDKTGTRVSACYGRNSVLPTEHLVYKNKLVGNINSLAFDSARPPMNYHLYLQNGGQLVHNYDTSPQETYVVFDNTSTVTDKEIFSADTASVTDAIALNDGGAFVLIASDTWTRLDRIGPDGKIWARYDSSFDNFPPQGTVKIAASPDDSLLALYIWTILGNQVQIFDLRTNDFASLTQQLGLICDYRVDNGATGNFSTDVVSNYKMTGTTYKLVDNFTIKHALTKMREYPANYYFEGSGYFQSASCNRFFGYLRIPYSNISMALPCRDASRFFLDSDKYSNGWEERSLALITSNVFSVGITHGKTVQFEHLANDQSTGMAPFFTTTPGPTVSGTGITDTTNHYYSGLNPPDSNWTKLPAAYTSPLRFTPQLIGNWVNPQDTPASTSVFLCYARDIASPTLWVFNAHVSILTAIPWGAASASFDLSASIPADTALGMAIAPDGQSLLIIASQPNRLYRVDISVPQTTTFGQVVSAVNLPQAPTCIAARPFTRYNTKKNTYETVATFAQNIGGNNQAAAVAPGGIYYFGAQSKISDTPSKDVIQYNPLTNASQTFVGRLVKTVQNHSVFAYDGEVYAMGGSDGTNPISWVQRWNPSSDESLSSIDTVTQSFYNISLEPPYQTDVSLPYETMESSYITGQYWDWGYHYIYYRGWRIFDNNYTNSYWYFNGTSGWVKIKFNNPVKINGISIWNDSDYGIKNFRIIDDANNVLYSGTAKNTGQKKDYNFSAWSSMANSLTIQVDSGYDHDGWFHNARTVLYEARFNMNGLRKLAPKNSSANNFITGGDINKAFDGNETSYIDFNPVAQSPSFEFELADPDIIDIIRIKTKKDMVPKSFTLLGSTNGTTFTPIKSFTNWPNISDWLISGFDNTTQYQYYKITIDEQYGTGGYIRIYEVECYSTQNAGQGTNIALEKVRADNPTTEVKLCRRAGAMTPYGYIIGGGADNSSVSSTCQVYWPNVIASYTDSSNFSYGLTRDLPKLGLPNTPTPLCGHTLVYHKGYLYRLGGSTSSTTSTSTTISTVNTVHRFNFASNSWEEVTPSPPGFVGRYMSAACSFGDEIFIFGGAQGSVDGTKTAVAWNPTTGSFRQLADIPSDTVGMTAVPCGPAIYLFGGNSSVSAEGSQAVWKYTP